MTSRASISHWFDRGVSMGATHMVVVCDTFDHSDYPVYAMSLSEAQGTIAHPGEMQRVMEVYNLSDPKDTQIEAHRTYNL